MALFDEVFNRASIYDMFFFNIKSVIEYPTLADLKANDEVMFERWLKICVAKYGAANGYEETYRLNAIKYPEYCKIVAISYATLYSENGDVKRVFKKISNLNEELVIRTFMEELKILSSNATKSSPVFFPSLCGHNIIGYDIPLLIKRYIKIHSFGSGDGGSTTEKQIPLILKRCLNIKPWESGLIDTFNIWKFNGFENPSLDFISDFLRLKKTVDLLSNSDLSKYFWDNIEENEKATLDYIGLQSATQTNLVIQLMNELRQY